MSRGLRATGRFIDALSLPYSAAVAPSLYNRCNPCLQVQEQQPCGCGPASRLQPTSEGEQKEQEQEEALLAQA